MNILGLLRQHNIEFIQGSENWIRIECPECRRSEKKYEDKTLSIHTGGRYHGGNCWRCGFHGNQKEILSILSILVLQEGETLSLQVEKPKSFTQPIPQECIEAWTHHAARQYLKSRSITKAQADKYAIYFCSSGFYHDRIIIPVFDHNKIYRTFVSRTIGDHDKGTKYLYPKGSSISRLLYNLLFYYGKQQHITLVEGIFDSIHVSNSVATFGKSVNELQINLLRMAGFQELFLMWDAECLINTPELWTRAVQRLSQYFIVHEVRLPHDTPTEFSVDELNCFCEDARTL